MTRLLPIVASLTLALTLDATCFAKGPSNSSGPNRNSGRNATKRTSQGSPTNSRRGSGRKNPPRDPHHWHHHHNGYQNGGSSDAGMATFFAWPTPDFSAASGGYQDNQSLPMAQTYAIQSLIQNMAEATRALNEARRASGPAAPQPETAPANRREERARPPVVTRTALTHATRPAVRLSAEQFDRRTGAIQWPEALQVESLAAQRGAIENLAAAQADSPETAQPDRSEVRRLTAEMKEQLKGRIRDLPVGEYVDAKKFVDALASELCSKQIRQQLAAN